MPKRDIRIMTWNIHGGIGVDQKEDLERVKNAIQEQDPDILGVNEISTIDIYNELKSLLDLFPYSFFAQPEGRPSGNAIFSKFKLKENESIELPLVESSMNRNVIKARATIEGEEWLFYVTHFSTYNKLKDHEAQAKFMLSEIEKYSHHFIVFIGDFNFDPSSNAYNILTRGQDFKLCDSYRFVNDDSGYTFRSNAPFKRVDYIMCTFNLIPITSKVICTEASDHCAVVTEF